MLLKNIIATSFTDMSIRHPVFNFLECKKIKLKSIKFSRKVLKTQVETFSKVFKLTKKNYKLDTFSPY